MSFCSDTIITIPDGVLGDMGREPLGGNILLGDGPSGPKHVADEAEVDIDHVELGSSFISSGSAQTAELREVAFDSTSEDDGEASNVGIETHNGGACPTLVESEIQPFSETDLDTTCAPYGIQMVSPPSLPRPIFGFQLQGTPEIVPHPMPHHPHLQDGGLSITMGSTPIDFPHTTSRPNLHMAVEKHSLVSPSAPPQKQQLFTEVKEASVTSLREWVSLDLSFLAFEPLDVPPTRNDCNPKCAYINSTFNPVFSSRGSLARNRMDSTSSRQPLLPNGPSSSEIQSQAPYTPFTKLIRALIPRAHAADLSTQPSQVFNTSNVGCQDENPEKTTKQGKKDVDHTAQKLEVKNPLSTVPAPMTNETPEDRKGET